MFYRKVEEVGLNRNNRNQELSSSCDQEIINEGVKIKTDTFTQIVLQNRS